MRIMKLTASGSALIVAGLLGLSNGGDATARLQDKSHVTTLYAVDDVIDSWSFSEGRPGTVCHDGRLFNRNSQLKFERYGGDLVSGIEGGSIARILDIGDLRIGGSLSSVYHGLTREDHVVVAKSVVKDESANIAAVTAERRFELAPGKGLAKATAKNGHVYLLRIDENSVTTKPVFVALRILDHEPGRYVTFRWRLL
jgi:hypothetical protein